VKPTETKNTEIPINDLETFQKTIAAEAGELIGEDGGMAFASGVLAGLSLMKSKAKRWAEDESEPLPEGEHHAAEETNGDDIDLATAELELDERAADYFRLSVEDIEKSIDAFTPKWQHKLLQVIVNRQSERDAQAEKEIRRQEATDRLHKTIDKWSTEEIEILDGVIEKAARIDQIQLVA
jgi:hypothetical protein